MNTLNNFLDHIDDIKEVPLSMMTTRMFRHIGRIIENELPIRNTILTGVEHKLKQKLIRKRGATGHREDDHSLRFLKFEEKGERYEG